VCKLSLPFRLVLLLAGFVFLLCGAPAALAHESPPGCTGSALGIDLSADAVDVHVGDTIHYSVTVFNGLPGSPGVACDATSIRAFIVTPDGKTNAVSLRRRKLLNGESDFYPNAAAYVVRAKDIRSNGTVRGKAYYTGVIHQSDTHRVGGGFKGLNTEVSKPCIGTPGIRVTQFCPDTQSSPGQLLVFSGRVKNTGNVTLTDIVVVGNQPAANTPVFTLASLEPGAVATFTGSYVAPINCCVTAILTARGASACVRASGIREVVKDTASATCFLTTSPQISVTADCPATPVVPGGVLAYTGTVRNTGDITLTNVRVFSDRPAANTAVFTGGTLAPGESASFTGSYTVPTNVCSVTATLKAIGRDIGDECPGDKVTNTFRFTCTVTPATTPSIAVTKECPPGPVTAGGTLVFTGTVTNTGNVTLTNVFVVDNQPAPNTPVLGPITLLAGAGTNFTGSYIVPCLSVTTLSTNAVTTVTTNTVTTFTTNTVESVTTNNFPVVTTNALDVVTTNTVTIITTNSVGSVTTNNVDVLTTNAVPVVTTNTVTTITTNSVGSVTTNNVDVVTTNTIPVVTTNMVTTITTNSVGSVTTNTVTTITTNTVTTITTNSVGSVTTNNVDVVTTNNVPVVTTNTVTTITTNSVGSVTTNNVDVVTTNNVDVVTTNTVTTITTNDVPVVTTNNVDVVTTNDVPVVTTNLVTTITTNNVDVVTTNNVPVITTNTVPVVTTNFVTVTVTNNTVTVTTNVAPPFFGTIDPRLPAVVDRFTVPPNMDGLNYADQDKGYAATQFYSIREDSSGTTFFDTITAGTAAVVDRFASTSRNFDSLAFAAPDVGYGSVIFYYLSHDSAGMSTFGSITPGGAVGVVTDHFVVGNDFDSLTFSATDVGYGANLFYYVRHNAAGVSTFGTINPAQPGTITDRFTVGSNVDALVFTSTDVGAGYGANNFYYIRHDSACVSTFGTIFVTGLTTATVTDRFPVGNNVKELTFTTTDTGLGPNLFYFLRGGACLSTNNVPVVTTNTVAVLTTNSVPVFTTNSVPVFTTNSVPVFTTNSVPVFTTNSVPVLTTNNVPVLTTNNVPVLTTNSVAVLTTNNVPVLTTNSIPVLTTNNVPVLTTNSVPVLTTNDVAVLTTNSVQVLTTNSVPVLTTNSVDVLTTNTVDVVTTNTVPVLTTNTVPVFTTNTVPVLTTNSVPVVTTNTVESVTTNSVPVLTTNSVLVVTTNSVPVLTTNTVPVVTTNSVPVLTTNSVLVVTTNSFPVVTTNTIPVVTTSTVPVLTTNTVPVVTPNVVPGVATDTVTASGTASDTAKGICPARTVTATASCSVLVQCVPPVIGGPGVPPPGYSNGALDLSFATEIGLSYTVQYKNSLSDPTWTDLPNMPVSGTDGVLTITDSTGEPPMRFYRVILTP